MRNLHLVRKGLLAAAAAGLMTLPIAAHADVTSEVTTAATHAGFAAKADKIQMVHTHMHHALNCLVGPNGKGFDSSALNPCKNNGNGAIPDSSDAKQKKMLEAAADTLRTGLSETDMAKAKATATKAETELNTAK